MDNSDYNFTNLLILKHSDAENLEYVAAGSQSPKVRSKNILLTYFEENKT